VNEFEAAGGRAAGAAESDGAGARAPVRAVPMKVGDATVFIEVVGEPLELEVPEGAEFEAVGGLDPAEAFEKASDALKECVKIVGERLEELQDKMGPDEVGVEFTISFDVEGQARIIPVLLTGKAKTAMGVKVTALWKPRERKK
jgi:hypothetical protein